MTEVNPGVTVAEIASTSLAAVKVFERYGIDYCCGGKRPLGDVCGEKGLDLASVENELSTALNAAAAEDREWNSAPLDELADHIVNRHHGYLRRECPGIAARLEKVYRVYNQRYGSALIGLPEVFAELCAELEDHMMKEEHILFPVISSYQNAVSEGNPVPKPLFGTVQGPIRMMEADHQGAGAHLEKIREITENYTVPDYACVTYRALIEGLRELEQDLHLHIHLENNILFPRAMAMEAAGNGRG
ncbi:MAG: iron-sulfur cluster repair di-iron protein [Bryobacterales bacterium]|nr:iron-sulfur cluster repair di-iron protein [Bryobacterales bacterium]